MPQASLRAARHRALKQVGADGQARIEAGTVLLVGMGGIGCAVAPYLASSGVGHLILNDFDAVDETNLGRQNLYRLSDVGRPKVDCARERLMAMNPDIEITCIADRLDAAQLSRAVSNVDIVFDGTDNFATRFLVNSSCVAAGKRLISGAAIRFEGQIAMFGPDYANSPCYRCLYAEADENLENCNGNGVLAPVPGVVGTLMAVEAIKNLADAAAAQTGIVQLYDGLTGQMQSVRVAKKTGCPVCNVI